MDKENTSSITAALLPYNGKVIIETVARKILEILSATIVFFYHTHSLFYILSRKRSYFKAVSRKPRTEVYYATVLVMNRLGTPDCQIEPSCS